MSMFLIRVGRVTFTNPRRAWLIARMASWLIVISVLARFVSLPRTLGIVATEVKPTRPKSAFDPVDLSTAIDALLATEFLVFKPSCWKRSIVLHRYLALQGQTTRILFGLKREAKGELKGHAWLEQDGKPILESTPPSYVVTYTFPSNQPFEVDVTVLAETTSR